MLMIIIPHNFKFSVSNRYCPGGPDSDFEYSTQSYTGYEPTSMRAIRARYNPYLQAKHRLEQVGHRCFTPYSTFMYLSIEHLEVT